MTATTNALYLGLLLCTLTSARAASADEPRYEGNELFGYIAQSPNSAEVKALRAFYEGKPSAVKVLSGKRGGLPAEIVFHLQVRAPTDKDCDARTQCKIFTGVLPLGLTWGMSKAAALQQLGTPIYTLSSSDGENLEYYFDPFVSLSLTINRAAGLQRIFITYEDHLAYYRAGDALTRMRLGDPALWKYLHARFSLPPSRGREAPVAAAPATGKSSERVKNDALALLHKRCSDPAINAFLQPYGQQISGEQCDMLTNPARRLESAQRDVLSGPRVQLIFRRGWLISIQVTGEGAGAAPPVRLPLGLQVGVTTDKEVAALRSNPAVNSVSASGSGSTIDLAGDNPFTIELAYDAQSRKVRSVDLAYRVSAADLAAEQAAERQEQQQWANLRARVEADLKARAPQPTAVPAPTPARAVAPNNAPTKVETPRMAQIRNEVEIIDRQNAMDEADAQYNPRADDNTRGFPTSYTTPQGKTIYERQGSGVSPSASFRISGAKRRIAERNERRAALVNEYRRLLEAP